MKSIIASVLFFVIAVPVTAQSLKHTLDVGVVYGDNIPVQSFYIETEIENGVKDRNGNKVFSIYEPAEIELTRKAVVDLRLVKDGLYTPGQYDFFVKLNREPEYTKGILYKKDDAFIYREIKGTKYDPRPCAKSPRYKSLRHEEGEDNSRGL